MFATWSGLKGDNSSMLFFKVSQRAWSKVSCIQRVTRQNWILTPFGVGPYGGTAGGFLCNIKIRVLYLLMSCVNLISWSNWKWFLPCPPLAWSVCVSCHNRQLWSSHLTDLGCHIQGGVDKRRGNWSYNVKYWQLSRCFAPLTDYMIHGAVVLEELR